MCQSDKLKGKNEQDSFKTCVGKKFYHADLYSRKKVFFWVDGAGRGGKAACLEDFAISLASLAFWKCMEFFKGDIYNTVCNIFGIKS